MKTIKDSEYLVVCGDFNDNVGKDVEGFDGVHGSLGFGSPNVEGGDATGVCRRMRIGSCQHLV